MSTAQLDNVREGAITAKLSATAAESDGGWFHPKPAFLTRADVASVITNMQVFGRGWPAWAGWGLA